MLEPLSKRARILIVDDEPANVRLLERLLGRAGYANLVGTTDPRRVPELAEAFDPDLILLDLHMPHRNGFEVLQDLRSRLDGGYLPVLVMTADLTRETRTRALSGGARDFLTKPMDIVEVELRIRNLLETRFLHLSLQEHNRSLEATVEERTRELEEARLEVLERLANVIEFRDDDTGKHTQRVGEIAAIVAAELGLPPAECQLVRRAAPLHDIGKVAISDLILLKPGRLTPEEFEIMKTHTTVGAGILSGGRSEMMVWAEQIALAHHERWDGSGYPQGLSEDRIPLPARIVALVDFFDALSHDRPYRAAWKPDRIREEIERERGRHFDPAVTDVFLRLEAQGLLGPRGVGFGPGDHAAGTGSAEP